MAMKATLFFCAQAFLIQVTFSQCINRGPVPAGPIGPLGLPNYGRGYDNFGYDDAWNRGLGYPEDFSLSSGGGFPITSVSPITPTGITVFSENAYEGPLSVFGELPFLGAVTLEGTLPTIGAGNIGYGCGNGATTMVSEGFGSELVAPGVPGYGRHGYDGCGRGLIY